MKHLILKPLIILAIGSAVGNANAAEMVTTAGSPIYSTACILEGDSSGAGRTECAFFIATGAGVLSMTSTSALLLKDIEAARPDAYQYAGGGAPSPLLYEVTGKIQKAYEESTGELLSFEDAVDVVLK